MESRIELDDTVREVVRKMSDGNPGAIGVMMGTIMSTEKLDPDSAFGEFTA